MHCTLSFLRRKKIANETKLLQEHIYAINDYILYAYTKKSVTNDPFIYDNRSGMNVLIQELPENFADFNEPLRISLPLNRGLNHNY